MRSKPLSAMLTFLALPLVSVGGCSVAPKAQNHAMFLEKARDGLEHFKQNVTGLSGQIAQSAGYEAFPGAGQ